MERIQTYDPLGARADIIVGIILSHEKRNGGPLHEATVRTEHRQTETVLINPTSGK